MNKFQHTVVIIILIATAHYVHKYLSAQKASTITEDMVENILDGGEDMRRKLDTHNRYLVTAPAKLKYIKNDLFMNQWISQTMFVRYYNIEYEKYIEQLEHFLERYYRFLSCCSTINNSNVLVELQTSYRGLYKNYKELTFSVPLKYKERAESLGKELRKFLHGKIKIANMKHENSIPNSAFTTTGFDTIQPVAFENISPYLK